MSHSWWRSAQLREKQTCVHNSQATWPRTYVAEQVSKEKTLKVIDQWYKARQEIANLFVPDSQLRRYIMMRVLMFCLASTLS